MSPLCHAVPPSAQRHLHLLQATRSAAGRRRQARTDVAGSGPPKLARQRARVAESELEAAREELADLRARLQVTLTVFNTAV